MIFGDFQTCQWSYGDYKKVFPNFLRIQMKIRTAVAFKLQVTTYKKRALKRKRMKERPNINIPAILK